jgi:large subunit ribosomal protein L14
MIMMKTSLTVADNSGARVVKCIHVNGSTGNNVAHIGDIVMVSVRSAEPRSDVKIGDKYYALIVRTKSKIHRSDSSNISFSDNAVVLLDKNFTRIGTRIFGPVAREIRDKFADIASRAPEVL